MILNFINSLPLHYYQVTPLAWIFLVHSLSLSVHPYHPSLPEDLPNFILRPHRLVVGKFLLVGQHGHDHVKGSQGEHHSSSVPYVMLVLLVWFYRWEESGRIAVVPWGVALWICSIYLVAFLCNSCPTFSHCVLSGASIELYWHHSYLEVIPFYFIE